MRRNGILMHISSLPSDYGIGTLGKAAYDFADYLEKAGQSVWQILPVNPTGFGDSPYASSASFAGNPYFIDLDLLEEDGLLRKEEYASLNWGDNPEEADFEKLYNLRYPLLEKAAIRFLQHPEAAYGAFKEENRDWLDDYALFMVLKKKHQGKPWTQWDDPYKTYTPKKAEQWNYQLSHETEIYKVWQYLFFKQWDALKEYVNEKGILMIGDVPIYCAMDSVDVWSSLESFEIDPDGTPIAIAGFPPDGFSPDGQVWGNPLYNWKAMKKDGYAWWIRRLDHLHDLYDILRMDHFIGFESYYAIDYKTMDPAEGKWMKGPGMDFFNAVKEKLDDPEIILEDLGIITPAVKKLKEETGYPGMKIMEFAFYDRMGEQSAYLPYNYEKNCVAYLGTHDNNTVMGWIDSLKAEDREYVQDFVHSYGNWETLHWDLIRTLLASCAETTILQAQDLKALGGWAQMNKPGSNQKNWVWRIKDGALDDENAAWVKKITETYARLPKPKKKATPKALEDEVEVEGEILPEADLEEKKARQKKRRLYFQNFIKKK